MLEDGKTAAETDGSEGSGGEGGDGEGNENTNNTKHSNKEETERRGTRRPAGLAGAAGLLLTIAACLGLPLVAANPDAKRLYDDLLSNYNRLIRPVGNNSDRLTVKMGLRLSQLIDINLKNQIMTTNVWVEQEWNDYKLKWNPDDYGGVDTLHVPSEHIWLPDIVLYNNADGNYEVTIMTKAILHHTGKVVWKPPAIYKSFCEIDVEYFPFDQQTCFMKFGSWTYDGYTVDLRHLLQSEDSNEIDVGIDLTDYYISVEWDILRVPAVRNEKFYICCEEPYPDIMFYITLRRKTLFYTVNLIIPCIGISFLSILVFYLPSHSGEKVSLSISILLSLTVFFLLLVEIIPSTSITVPLLGKYLLFTMVLVTLSVVVTIAVLNVNFRSPVTHRMAPWVRLVFIEMLPKLLMIERPARDDDDSANPEGHPSQGPGHLGPGADEDDDDDGLDDLEEDEEPVQAMENGDVRGELEAGGPKHHPEHAVFHVQERSPKYQPGYCNSSMAGARFAEYELAYQVPGLPFGVGLEESGLPPLPGPEDERLFGLAVVGHPGGVVVDELQVSPSFECKPVNREVERTMEDARFIAQHAKNEDKFGSVEEDWKYVAMVIDRIFLWLFGIACIVGTLLIIFQAPSLYDTTKPIDIMYSKIAKKKLMLLNMAKEED
ncbi:acetylcholine receptor subunit alpha-like 1 [Copidosoma floridanum]|uniref:acetylcholine receptor subunit alpha-like 1 n=1 Tax=Copidosoma floridanum TaxID=29053 RepID=UPI0006C95E44|nr:acetylcholine receptor subunit alpha-like 1 [Copidosoma floridanum]